MLKILFTETATNLRSFLQSVLPTIDTDWWKKFVVSALSFQQMRNYGTSARQKTTPAGAGQPPFDFTAEFYRVLGIKCLYLMN